MPIFRFSKLLFTTILVVLLVAVFVLINQKFGFWLGAPPEKDLLVERIPADIDFYVSVNLNNLNKEDWGLKDQALRDIQQEFFADIPINFITNIWPLTTGEAGLFKLTNNPSLFLIFKTTNEEVLSIELEKINKYSRQFKRINQGFYIFSSELSDFSAISSIEEKNPNLFIKQKAGEKYLFFWQKEAVINSFFRADFIRDKAERIFASLSLPQKSIVEQDVYLKLAKKQQMWQFFVAGLSGVVDNGKATNILPKSALFSINHLAWDNLPYFLAQTDLLVSKGPKGQIISNLALINHLVDILAKKIPREQLFEKQVAISITMPAKRSLTNNSNFLNNEYGINLVVPGVSIALTNDFEAEISQLLAPLTIYSQKKILPDGTQMTEELIDYNQVSFQEKDEHGRPYRQLENNQLNIHLTYTILEDKLFLSTNAADLLIFLADNGSLSLEEPENNCEIAGGSEVFVNMYYLLIESLAEDSPSIIRYYQKYFTDYKSLILGKNFFGGVNICVW